MSNSVRLHRRQLSRLPCPWDSPGKNTGVGCHFLLQCMKVKSESEVAQPCPTLSDPMDCSLPDSSIHGIFQARVLEWGAIAFSMWSLYRCSKTVSWINKHWMNQEHYFLNCQAIPVFGWVGLLDKTWRRKLEEALDFFPDISFLKLRAGQGEGDTKGYNQIWCPYIMSRLETSSLPIFFILWKILLSYFSCSLKKKKISSRFSYRLVRDPCASSLQTYLRSKYDLLWPRLANPLRQ